MIIHNIVGFNMYLQSFILILCRMICSYLYSFHINLIESFCCLSCIFNLEIDELFNIEIQGLIYISSISITFLKDLCIHKTIILSHYLKFFALFRQHYPKCLLFSVGFSIYFNLKIPFINLTFVEQFGLFCL